MTDQYDGDKIEQEPIRPYHETAERSESVEAAGLEQSLAEHDTPLAPVKKSKRANTVATVRLKDYIMPDNWWAIPGHGKNAVNGKLWEVEPYNQLCSVKEQRPVFYASVTVKEGKSKERKVGDMFTAVANDPVEEELYHRGLAWKYHPGSRTVLHPESMVDIPVTKRKNNDAENPKLTGYVVDLGEKGSGSDLKYQIQEKNKDSRQSLKLWKSLPLNFGAWVIGKLPWTNSDVWKAKKIEFGQLFDVSGNFGLGDQVRLTLNEAPIKGAFRWQQVRYDLVDDDYNVYATFHTEGGKRFLSGGVLPTPPLRHAANNGKAGWAVTGDGTFADGPIRLTPFNTGFVERIRTDIYDERLMTESFYQFAAMTSDILKADILEGTKRKLRRTCSFDLLPAQMAQFES